MTNGGTGPYKGKVLLVTSGRAELPPSIVLVDPHPPYNVTVLLDNFFGTPLSVSKHLTHLGQGRQFNSLNDIKVHPSGNIFFTDPT